MLINQGLVIPAGLADGSTAAAAQITPLYNSLNAFVLPDTVGVFQQAFVSDSLYTVATGATQDWTLTASVSKTKALIALVSFSWSGAAAAPTFTFRMNAAAVTAAIALTNAATGNGLLRVWIGAHDTTDAPRPLHMTIIDDGGTISQTMPNADLPNVNSTSVGLTIGGAGNTFKFKYIRIWKEG